LKTPEFHFKKKRIVFLQLLNPDSQNTNESQDAMDLQETKSLSADLTRSVSDVVLGKQDEKSTLAYLETFRKDDKGIISRVLGFLRSSRGEEELWESARKRARLISDSEFLRELKTIPVDHYLHEAATDVEETAYDFLTKQVDISVSVICRQIILAQKKERDRQVQLDVDIEEAREVQILWSEFVRQVKDVSTLRSTSYVSHGIRNGLITLRGVGAQLSTSTTSMSGNHLSPGVCLNSSLQPERVSSVQTDTFYLSGRQEYLREAEIEHRIHLLHLRADESQKVQLDPSYVPAPILEERLTHSFHVSTSTIVKYGLG
jgi:hypothetical protein